MYTDVGICFEMIIDVGIIQCFIYIYIGIGVLYIICIVNLQKPLASDGFHLQSLYSFPFSYSIVFVSKPAIGV